MTAISGLEDLKRQHPEWEPWLAVVQEALHETADPKWDAAVPVRTSMQVSKVPLLAEATIQLNNSSLGTWVEHLIRVAYRSGTDRLSTLNAALQAKLDTVSLFKASLQQDGERINHVAMNLGVDPEAFQAVLALLPVPFLQACNRRWARSVASWGEGYCPVCGTWPAFAEIRGIERSRYLRCGRCGAEWQAYILFCPYCGNTDHKKQVSLIAENSSKSAVDACKVCLGYVKIFTTLQGSPPERVILDDLASVEMDMAAAEQGYRRPQGTGYYLNVVVSESGRCPS